MLDTLRNWAATNRVTTWMIVGSIIVTAMIVHPRLLSYIMLVMNGAWMFIIREIARHEGAMHAACLRCALAALAVLLLCGLVVLKINWLAV